MGSRGVFVLLGTGAARVAGPSCMFGRACLITAAASAFVFISHEHEGAALLLLIVLSLWVEGLISLHASASLDALSPLCRRPRTESLLSLQR